MGVEVLIPIFGILLVLVPVTGITLILTTRFALKPFMETLATTLRSTSVSAGEVRGELQELTDQVERLTHQVVRLQDAHAFEQKLLEGRTGADLPG